MSGETTTEQEKKLGVGCVTTSIATPVWTTITPTEAVASPFWKSSTGIAVETFIGSTGSLIFVAVIVIGILVFRLQKKNARERLVGRNTTNNPTYTNDGVYEVIVEQNNSVVDYYAEQNNYESPQYDAALVEDGHNVLDEDSTI